MPCVWSQVSKKMSMKIPCNFQVRTAGSYATVQTVIWRRPDAPWCLEASALKMSGRQSNTVQTLGQASPISTRSLFLEVDTVWEVSTICPDDEATRPDDVQSLQAVRTTRQHVRTISSNSNNSRFPFERWKDFNEDRPDARSRRLGANLIKIELRGFWKDIAENRSDEANFRPDAR
jgi:hypothetical protein